MSRKTMKTRLLSPLLLGLLASCGGLPMEDPQRVAHSTEYSNVGDDVLAQAPAKMVEEALPGCEDKRPPQALGQDAVLMRHPGSHSLVVVIEDGAPVCIGTRVAALVYLGQAETAPTTQMINTFASSEGYNEDDPVPVSPAKDPADPAGDDPVPVTPNEGDAGKDGPANGTKPAGDDPVPITPGGEKGTSDPDGTPTGANGGTQPDGDDPVPVRGNDQVTASPHAVSSDQVAPDRPMPIDPRYVQPRF